MEKFHSDPTKVILLGFSQGAIMSFAIALTKPEKVKGIVALSGRILPEFDKLLSSRIERDMPKVFIGHGKYDGILPVQHARESLQKLKQIGIEPTYQ